MVVAPISWISPRESWGFKILAASIEPSAAPAPMILWISSINRITSFALAASSIRFLTRSSNSPRYFVPATIETRSSEISRLFCKTCGTFPCAIRWASPSAIAVFPTPASPIRQGLFLLRRDRIRTTRSISFSRPMTGSSSLFLAFSVKSRPNLSSRTV